jgi:energy-coupling factor transport system substrate-specific component
VSWQLASFALVLIALALALWWYERSRPPAKLIALVATLAALAALGRDAFAAVPDVKPITAIVLISGLAFGAGPGFAVGAVSGLASNLLLGEGPWTPWQMLAWGLVGATGGAAGPLLRRNRGALIAFCAVWGLVFDAILNVVDLATFGPSWTWQAFWALEGRGLPFDVAHAAGNVVLAAVAGPSLIRLLDRYGTRLRVELEPELVSDGDGELVAAP